MTVFEFFNSSPVLATILTLAYTAVMVVLVCMLVKMYRK